MFESTPGKEIQRECMASGATESSRERRRAPPRGLVVVVILQFLLGALGIVGGVGKEG